jgi:hypothetical protein
MFEPMSRPVKRRLCGGKIDGFHIPALATQEDEHLRQYGHLAGKPHWIAATTAKRCDVWIVPYQQELATILKR